MRATEILGSAVVDTDGVAVSRVRDVRLVERDGRFHVVGLVVGDGFLAEAAHRTGYVAGRASGPWLFRLLARSATRRARFVPAESVVSWGRDSIAIDLRSGDLPRLVDVDG